MKRNHRVLVAAIAALVAGAVAWRVWPRSAEKAPTSGAHGGAESGHAHGDGHTPIDEPELRGGPGPILGQDDPPGALRLEGQVLDDEEEPVADAVVTVGSAPPRQARTGADGSFAFDGLLARPYAVTARAPSGVAGPVTARLSTTSPPVVLHLRKGAQVTVDVVDARQQPIAAAMVELRGPADQAATTTSGKATFDAVVPGYYTVVALADGYGHAYLPAIVGQGTTSLRLELARGAPVSGRVVDERGGPIAGARVRFDSAADFGPGATGGSGFRDGVTTGADGAFMFASLPAGSFRFLANHGDYAPAVSSLISLDGQAAKDGVEIVLPAGAVISGTVVDGQGRAVASARVRVGVAAMGFRATAPPREAYSDASGAFVVRGMPRRELLVVAQHETGASATAPVDATSGEVKGVRLTIDATGTIAGVVVDASGEPVDGAQVTAAPDIFGRRRGEAPSGAGPAGGVVQWQLRGFPQDLTDPDGRFVLTGLPPGAYNISAVRAAAVSRGRRFPGDNVIAKTGDKAVRVVLPAEGALRGKVAFADGSAPARFTVAIGFSQQSFAGGELAIDSLTPQRYQLVVRGSSFETRVLDAVVEPGKTTDLGTIVVVAGRRIGGVVLADGKPVAGATVWAGTGLVGSGDRAGGNPAGGPPSSSAKQATTGADGTFSLEGFADVEIVLVAEHAKLGRSRPLRWGTGAGQDVVRLSLLPAGSLVGSVTRGGKPVEGVMVTAQSMSAGSAMAMVPSGPDGIYRFDRLAPDIYKVSAMVGTPAVKMQRFSKQVDVKSGEEARVDLAVTVGAITLDVEVTATNGAPGLLSWSLLPGRVFARTLGELGASEATSGGGSSQFGFGAAPLQIVEVATGISTVCVVAYPREIDKLERLLPYMEQHIDLAAVCQTLEVRTAPTKQSVALTVTVPPLRASTPPHTP